MTTLQQAVGTVSGLTWRASAPYRPTRGDAWLDGDGVLRVAQVVYGERTTTPVATSDAILTAVHTAAGWEAATAQTERMGLPGVSVLAVTVRQAGATVATALPGDADTSPASTGFVAAAVAARTQNRRSIYEWGTPDRTGATDCSAIFQAAVTALGDEVAAGAQPVSLIVPAGKFRLDSTVTWRSGVGLQGAGMGETVLLPYGEVVAIKGGTPGGSAPTSFFDDCRFADFTVDATNQADADGSSASGMKGIFIVGMRRGRFDRVAVLNAMWTGFGMDYDQDVTFTSCYAAGNGRASAASVTAGAGAGFGIATGWFDDEVTSFINCVSVNNKTHGFFSENKSSGPTKYSRGFRMVGCYAAGNFVGYVDAGCTGAVVTGCTFTQNLESGVKIGRTGANAQGGVRGIVSNCIITGNGTADTAVTTNLCGVQLREMGNGGYQITDNIIEGNVRYGIYAGGSAAFGGAVIIKGNTIYGHPRSGIRIVPTAGASRLNISNNELVNNGTDTAAGSTQRDGITIGCSTDHLTIRGNRCYDTQGAKTQLYGVALRDNTKTSLVPTIKDNDLRDNSTGGFLNEHTTADTTHIADNITA